MAGWRFSAFVAFSRVGRGLDEGINGATNGKDAMEAALSIQLALSFILLFPTAYGIIDHGDTMSNLQEGLESGFINWADIADKVLSGKEITLSLVSNEAATTARHRFYKWRLRELPEGPRTQQIRKLIGVLKLGNSLTFKLGQISQSAISSNMVLGMSERDGEAAPTPISKTVPHKPVEAQSERGWTPPLSNNSHLQSVLDQLGYSAAHNGVKDGTAFTENYKKEITEEVERVNDSPIDRALAAANNNPVDSLTYCGVCGCPAPCIAHPRSVDEPAA